MEFFKRYGWTFFVFISLATCTEDDPIIECVKLKPDQIQINVIDTAVHGLKNAIFEVIIPDEFREIATFQLDDEDPQESFRFFEVPPGPHMITINTGPHCEIVYVLTLNEKYQLQVNEGFGSGFFPPFVQVTILADSTKPGKIFKEWSGDTDFLPNATENPITFAMPNEDMEITAIYQDAFFTLTVEGGEGSGIYAFGEKVTIRARDPEVGEQFSHWVGESEILDDSLRKSTTFIMPASDLSISAEFGPSMHDLQVYSGSGSGTYAYGSVVPIAASNAPNFIKWLGDVENIDNENSHQTTITIFEDTEVLPDFGPVTWQSDIFPILDKHCTSCHEQQADYSQAILEASGIRTTVTNCTMPLTRCLSEKETRLIIQWVIDGVPEK